MPKAKFPEQLAEKLNEAAEQTTEVTKKANLSDTLKNSLDSFGVETNDGSVLSQGKMTPAKPLDEAKRKEIEALKEAKAIHDKAKAEGVSPYEIKRRNESMKKAFQFKPSKGGKDVNHDEDELLKEAWRKEYQNCLVNIWGRMEKHGETIEKMVEDVKAKKSVLPRNTRDFLLSTNPKYIEGWLSRMFRDYFEVYDEVYGTHATVVESAVPAAAEAAKAGE